MKAKKPEWHEEISFDGNAYLDLDKKLVSHKENMRMEIELEFSTWEPNGLLLWQGKRQRREADSSSWDTDPQYDSNYMALAG